MAKLVQFCGGKAKRRVQEERAMERIGQQLIHFRYQNLHSPEQKFARFKQSTQNFPVEKFSPFIVADKRPTPLPVCYSRTLETPMARILISGASGMVGTALVPTAAGGRGADRAPGAAGVPLTPANKLIPWDPAQPISPDAVSGFDAVIHLAGENIVGRWTADKKARDSRQPHSRHDRSRAGAGAGEAKAAEFSSAPPRSATTEVAAMKY